MAMPSEPAVTARAANERSAQPDPAAHEREAVVELFRLFDAHDDLHAFLGAVTRFLSEWAGFEAVGIRLRDGEDFTYFETTGYSDKFVVAERSLCARVAGQVVRDEAGAAVLECMCGNVLCGRVDPSLPFFTAAGAFHTNGSTALLQTFSAEERGKLRNRCNAEGYESIGLFPIRLRGETFGLLQLNDRRRDRFDAAALSMFERIAESLAMALAHRRAEHELALARQVQEALHAELTQRAAEAEQASRAKDEFLAVVSHELRAPLNVILLNAQLLEAGRDENPRTQRSLAAIKRAVHSQAKLIDDLLDVARILSGKLQLELERVDVGERVRAALEGVQLQASKKSIQLSTSIAEELGPVRADPTRLTQIVSNLLGNAIKFTPPGGHVHVAVDRDGARASIEVRDDGHGISAEFLPRIFDRFAQAESTSTRTHGGLGLGLAIVRHLVEALGGAVAVHSDGIEKGTTVRVSFPFETRDSAAPSAQPAELRAARLRGARVLVVDDDPETREALASVLDALGAETWSASSVLEAIDAIDRNEPSVVLCDLAMPSEDGFGLMRRLDSRDARLAREARDAPTGPSRARPFVVAVTAMASPTDRQRVLAAGFTAHLGKPVDVPALVSLVGELAAADAARAE
jgi:signal transduction histidine kinase